MGLSMECSCLNCGANIQACDIKTIRSLALAVLDDCHVYSVTDICDLILKKHGSIPYKNWKVQVSNILITESERSESCVWSSLHNNEQIFGLVKNVEEWLTFRQSRQPPVRYKIMQQPLIDTTIKEGALKGFNPERPRVPPEMSKERAQTIARGLASMNYRRDKGERLNIETLLEFPDTKKLNYARDAWNLSRHNVILKVFIFNFFRNLVPEDDVWTDAIIEAVCGLSVRSHIDDGPLQDSSRSFFSIPPGLDKRLAVGYILLLNFMKDAPHESKIHSGYFTGSSNRDKERISSLRMILSYNPSLGQLIQPVLDQNPQ